jgi:DNA-binding response OmpR family regulator
MERTLDSHVSRIRRKLGPEAAACLRTVWGVGYRFSPGGMP